MRSLEKEDFLKIARFVLFCPIKEAFSLTSCEFWNFSSERWQSTLFQIFFFFFAARSVGRFCANWSEELIAHQNSYNLETDTFQRTKVKSINRGNRKIHTCQPCMRISTSHRYSTCLHHSYPSPRASCLPLCGGTSNHIYRWHELMQWIRYQWQT